MVGNYIPKSIMKVTAFKILLNFPPSLSLLFREICRQSNLHSCKESNYRFPNLFLEKNVKVPVYPVASCVREVQFQDLLTQSLPLQFINMNDHLKMCILYLNLEELSNVSTLGRGRNLPVFFAGPLKMVLGKILGKWKQGEKYSDSSFGLHGQRRFLLLLMVN